MVPLRRGGRGHVLVLVQISLIVAGTTTVPRHLGLRRVSPSRRGVSLSLASVPRRTTLVLVLILLLTQLYLAKHLAQLPTRSSTEKTASGRSEESTASSAPALASAFRARVVGVIRLRVRVMASIAVVRLSIAVSGPHVAGIRHVDAFLRLLALR